MKLRYHNWTWLFLIILFPVIFGCAADEELDEAERPEQTFNLSLATFWPATDFMVAEGHNKWIEEVEKRTDGRVQINLHSGESLLGAREIYNGVAGGVADIGTTCPSYTPGMFPLMEAFELPGYQNVNAVSASMTAHEGYKRIKQDLGVDEFEDVKVLFFWATGPGDIMSKKPARNLQELAGMEIRAVGGTVPPLEKLGAVTHSMPMSESYLALDQGLVDGILAPNDTLKGFRLAEVVDYVTHTPFLYNVVFMKIMNKGTWNSLPPDIQDVFREMNDEFAYEYGLLRAEHTKLGLEYGMDEHGMEFFELEEDEEQKWLERIQPVVEDWIKKQEDRGLPAEQAVELIRELDEKFSAEYFDY
ncbi:TRAP transporter substrate-binding protein [Desulfonatronospira sp.]|uniref:TRAP transporter substrate-binding protein n=1 Tax=Desulfonatronospira sp. TaxID=1962951 RepID=UPI0025BBBACF|nr:TRAP transporter substrate-binding protein [Desulfonatronospira sp.]